MEYTDVVLARLDHIWQNISGSFSQITRPKPALPRAQCRSKIKIDVKVPLPISINFNSTLMLCQNHYLIPASLLSLYATLPFYDHLQPPHTVIGIYSNSVFSDISNWVWIIKIIEFDQLHISWVHVIAVIACDEISVFGCPTNFTNGAGTVRLFILFSIAVICKIWKVFN